MTYAGGRGGRYYTLQRQCVPGTKTPRASPQADPAIGKHVAKSDFGCFDSACACAAFTCVLGKHCMQTVHFKSMLFLRFSRPAVPPPPAPSFAALAAFFARAMAVFCALPPPMASEHRLPSISGQSKQA